MTSRIVIIIIKIAWCCCYAAAVVVVVVVVVAAAAAAAAAWTYLDGQTVHDTSAVDRPKNYVQHIFINFFQSGIGP